MKGGCWIESPKRGGAVHLFYLAGLIMFLICLPTASAWSFPFSIPFFSSSDEGCELSLDLDQPQVEYGNSITYTIHLKNSGHEALTSISVTDNFGQAGFIARLPEGESFALSRTTPPLESSTSLRVVAISGGEEICRAEAAVQVGLREVGFSIPDLDFDRSMAWEDPTLRIMSASPEIELVVGADPKAVRPGEKTTVRMTVTNRCSMPLRDVEISGPGWTVEAGDLNPGESKTYSRTLTIAEDLSAELTASGATDGGERAFDQELLEVAAVSSDLSVNVIYTPASSGQAATTEYRLKNEGDEVLSRVTLKDGEGGTLGILPQLAPGESESLTRTWTQDEGAGGPAELTAVSPEGKTVAGDVIVQPASIRPGASAARQPTSRSGSTRTTEPTGFGAMPEFEEMGTESIFGDIGSGIEVLGTQTDPGSPRMSQSAAVPEIQDLSTDAGFGGFNMGFDFSDFGFGEIFGGGSTTPITPSEGSKAASGSETGSSNLVVTLQANRTLVHKGDMVGYRCAAVNRGTATLADLTLRCGERTATASNLAPGDGLPLEGAMRAEGPLNLMANATASGPGGSMLSDEVSLEIGVISPDLLVEVYKVPERICRGQRISIAVRLENSGDDALSDVRVADALGEIGKIPILEPGEVRTLMRNSTLDESLEDVVMVVAVDSTGRRLQMSQNLNFELLEPSLNLTVDPRNAAAYPGEAVEVVWTIRNSGEVDLVDVTFDGVGASRFRLPAVAAGGSTPVSSTYFAEESRVVSGRAVGMTAGGETVSDSAAFDMRVISPGISLNVKPIDVEACPEQVFNLTCLVTNSGDDPLKDVTVSEKSLGTLEKIGRLEPGDFKVTTLDFFAVKNTTFKLKAEGIDSIGNAWTDSKDVAVNLVSANIEITVSADPPETTPGGAVSVVCTVENRGDVPIFSTFVMGRSLGHLGTIDYISPGSSRTLERKIEVSEQVEDEITAEGFTKDRASVRDQAILSVGLIEPPPPAEEVMPAEASEDEIGAQLAGIAEVGYQEGVGLGEMVNASELGASQIQEDDVTGITGLMNRLREILERIRLNKQSSAGTMDTTSSKGMMPVGSDFGSSTSAPPSSSPPDTSTEWSGYGTYEGATNASPLSSEGALLEGAGYAPSGDMLQTVPVAGDLSPIGPSAEMVGYSYSAEGIASSYLSSPWTSSGSSGCAYSASDPASAYLSSAWTSPGTLGYTSSEGGPSLSMTSPAGISATIAGSQTPTRYENADPRSAFEASPKVAESRASTESSSFHGRSEISPGYAGAAASADSPSMDRPFQSKSPTENIRLVIGDPGTIEVDRPPRVIDVGAFPPEPTAWSPVVVAVHASDDIGIRSVEMLWDTPSTAVSRLDLVDITKINSQRMELEDGDAKDGYWSYEIPGQAAGTYMAVFVKVSDGERWAEDGPYILFWSAAATESETVPPDSEEMPAEDGGSRNAVETKRNGMLFVESTTVIGRGDVSIKNEVREDNARYREELSGSGSIEMQSEKVVNKGNPIVNITDSRLLVFDQGYLKGFKVMQSPGFHGGMGASVTEQFNATTLEKSETGTISSVNRSDHSLIFNTQQAFEGIWGTKTEYSNFNKKIKANQRLNGTFETQKRISFED